MAPHCSVGEARGNHAAISEKGMLVYIEGRIQTRQWEDKRDGQKRSTTEIVANVMRMLDVTRRRRCGCWRRS